jgi:uncharacterized protein
MPRQSSSSVRVVFPRFNRDELVTELCRQLPELERNLPVRRVVLFGSWAAGRATAYSDIDLLVIYAGSPRDDAFKVVRRSIQLRGLEPHVYTETEAESLRPTLDRMTQNGIQLL